MAGSHGPCRGRRVGVGIERGPPLAHVGGVKGGSLGLGVGACLQGEELGCIRIVMGEAQGHGQHSGVGRVAPHALSDGGVGALSGGPETTGGGVRRCGVGTNLSGAPPRKSPQEGWGPTGVDVTDERRARGIFGNSLFSRGSV